MWKVQSFCSVVVASAERLLKQFFPSARLYVNACKDPETTDGSSLNFVLNSFMKYCRTILVLMYIGHYYRPLYVQIYSCYCTQASQYWWNEPTVVTGLAADIQTQSH